MEFNTDFFLEMQRDAALSRQGDIIPFTIQDLSVLLIGVGGIGSNVAHMLASMGITDMTLIDPQDVALENTYPGWFRWGDVGSSKVRAVAYRLQEEFGVSDNIIYERDKFINLYAGSYDVVVVSTDSLTSRREAWEIYLAEGERQGKPLWNLWIDARMGGTNAEVYALTRDDPELISGYNKRLLGKDVELACGMKATAPLTKGVIPSMVAQAIYDVIQGKQPAYCRMYDLRTGRTIIARR